MKKYMKSGLDLAKTGVGLGVMGGVMSDMGADSTPITKISGKLPVVGSMIGAGMVIEYTKKLGKKK